MHYGHFTTTLSITVTLAKKIRTEWDARMANSWYQQILCGLFVFSYSTIVDSSCLVAAVLN